jgi:hypothetical protein
MKPLGDHPGFPLSPPDDTSTLPAPAPAPAASGGERETEEGQGDGEALLQSSLLALVFSVIASNLSKAPRKRIKRILRAIFEYTCRRCESSLVQ